MKILNLPCGIYSTNGDPLLKSGLILCVRYVTKGLLLATFVTFNVAAMEPRAHPLGKCASPCGRCFPKEDPLEKLESHVTAMATRGNLLNFSIIPVVNMAPRGDTF